MRLRTTNEWQGQRTERAMGISIRLWIIVAVNAMVLAVSGLFGWIAQDAAGRVAQERAVETVRGVSRFLAGETYPLSDRLMGYLREMLNADWIAVSSRDSRVVASSLPGAATSDFERRTVGSSAPDKIELAGTEYRLYSHDLRQSVPHPSGQAVDAGDYRLYVLVPSAVFADLRAQASQRVVRAVLPATAGATLLAVTLALLITAPLSRLSREMDQLAQRSGKEGAGAESAARDDRRHLLTRGPRETRALAASFYGLLDRLRTARGQLVRSERLAALGKVSLSIAHELRNPLSGIKMNVRVLQDELSAEAAPGVEAIAREIDRMTMHLNDLMSLAPANGHTRPSRRPETVKLSALADGVLAILAGRCRHARITVVRDVPPAEPAVVADAGQVRQAIMNLAVNAIEAMPEGGKLAIAVEDRGEWMRLIVRDSGPGVNIADADIFEAFVTGKPDGVGLGLYLCRQIIDAHGGRIGHDSSADGGCFWFELPSGTGEVAQQGEPAEAIPAGSAS